MRYRNADAKDRKKAAAMTTAAELETAGTPTPGTAAGISTGTPDAASLSFDLRRLWQRKPEAGTAAETLAGTGAAIGTATPTARKPTAAELLADRTPRRCWTHTDPREWLDEPAHRRPGFIRSTCRRCGGFVGYRPAEPGAPKRKARR